MTHQDHPDRASSPFLTAAGAVLFIAILIAGTGMVSFFTSTDPVEVSGLGALPGVLGVGLATVLWLVFCWRTTTLGGALLAAFFAAIGYVAGIAVAALVSVPESLVAVISHLVLSWYPVAVAVAGLLAAVLIVVLRRNGGSHAQWPWEREHDE